MKIIPNKENFWKCVIKLTEEGILCFKSQSVLHENNFGSESRICFSVYRKLYQDSKSSRNEHYTFVANLRFSFC